MGEGGREGAGGERGEGANEGGRGGGGEGGEGWGREAGVRIVCSAPATVADQFQTRRYWQLALLMILVRLLCPTAL
eukprot:9469543-Pyramimonas_sp.AAC.1